MNILDVLLGNGVKSVRTKTQLRVTVDREGNPIIEPVAAESITLSDEGSIDTTTVVQDRFYHCGCSAEVTMGGRCAEPGCGRVSCVRCFGRCNVCSKPICLEHSIPAVSQSGAVTRLCRHCYDAIARKRVLRAVLSPFVVFHQEEHQ